MEFDRLPPHAISELPIPNRAAPRSIRYVLGVMSSIGCKWDSKRQEILSMHDNSTLVSVQPRRARIIEHGPPRQISFHSWK